MIVCGVPPGDEILIWNVDDGSPDYLNTVSISGLLNTHGATHIYRSQSRGHTLIVPLTVPSLFSSLAGGGGIQSESGSLTVRNSTISGNVAGGDGSGGGISSERTSVSVTDSVLVNNSAAGKGGGAIYNLRGELLLQRSTISGNRTDDGRGAINVTDGNLLLEGSTVANNRSLSGGGLFLKTNLVDWQATVRNSTISGNIAAFFGGGLYNQFGRTMIANSTITDNLAQAGKGSGVFSNDGLEVQTEVRSSIIAGNRNTDIDILAGGSNSFVSQGYNLIGTSSLDATSALFAFQNHDQTGVLDPQLESLQDNGGPTRTHLLRVTSLAVDRGDPSAKTGLGDTPLYDQRGTPFSRVTKGRLDIGALELPSTEVDADFNDDGLYALNDLDSLATAIALGLHPTIYDLTYDQRVDLADHDAWLTAAGARNLKPGRPYPQGDSNLDGLFDSSDLVAIFQQGEYEDALQGNSSWSDGDWNCDGDSTTADLVTAFQTGMYEGT